METCIGLGVGAMKTFPHINIEPSSFGRGLGRGLSVRQCKHAISGH